MSEKARQEEFAGLLRSPWRPVAISDVDVGFPGLKVCARVYPSWSDCDGVERVWREAASHLFFSGGRPVWRDGIDGRLATRHLRCVLGTFSSSHEYKEAAAGLLLKAWCRDVLDSEGRSLLGGKDAFSFEVGFSGSVGA